MTAQDWMTGLEEDEESAETVTPRGRRWLVAGAAAMVAVVALVALAAVLIGRTPAPRARSTATAPLAGPAPRVAAGPPPVGPVLIQAALDYPGIVDSVVPTAPLIVGTEPVQGGSVPDRVPNFDSCHADPASLQYLPVQIRMPENWLSARFTVQPTPSTPAGVGRLGFFFQAGQASIPCPAGAWSTSDSFLANGGQTVITGYVVLDRAFTSATPQGRPDVFRTLGLRVSNIRLGSRPAEVHRPTVGAFCPGTTSDLCASLG